MTALYIFLGLLLILLCSRYGVVLSYLEGKFSFRLRFGFLTFQLPKNKKKPKKEKPPKPKEEKPKEDKKKKKKFSMPPWNQLPELARMALKALGRIFRSIRIEELMLHLNIGTQDPYDTAVDLNYANAAAEILLNSGLLHIKKQDVVISPDFVNEKIEADGRLALSLRLYKLIAAALALLFGYLRWKRKLKKITKEAERN